MYYTVADLMNGARCAPLLSQMKHKEGNNTSAGTAYCMGRGCCFRCSFFNTTCIALSYAWASTHVVCLLLEPCAAAVDSGGPAQPSCRRELMSHGHTHRCLAALPVGSAPFPMLEKYIPSWQSSQPQGKWFSRFLLKLLFTPRQAAC